MLKPIAVKLHKDRDEILNFCNSHKRLFLYGAGYVSKLMQRYLDEENIKISGIIVDSDTESAKKKEGVIAVSEMRFLEDDGIILAVRMALQPEIKAVLKKECNMREDQIYGQRIYVPYLEWYEKIYSMNWRESRNGYFSQYDILDKLGQRHGTDKSSADHNYLNKYEFFLRKWKDKPVVLLELGVYKGSSIKMWGDYFKSGIIYGVDIDEECRQYEGENRHIIIRDLGDEEKLDELGELRPEIIIDDASHFWSHQIKTIYHLIPALANGGIFIMEDLSTSFEGHKDNGYNDAIISAYEFCQALAKVVNSGTFMDIESMIPALVPLRNEIAELAEQLEMICFIHGSCIMIKK